MEKLTQRFGKPNWLTEDHNLLHWDQLSAQISPSLKIFVVGFIYDSKDGKFTRQTQESPYVLPNSKPITFANEKLWLDDLELKIKGPAKIDFAKK